MGFKDRTYLCLSFLIFLTIIALSAAFIYALNNPINTRQNFWKIHSLIENKPDDKRIKIVWCTISREEQHKCLNFAMAIERDRISVGYDTFKIECKQAYNKEDCMKMLDEEQATLTTLDTGEVFIGGRYHSLVPIAQEVLDGGFKHYYAVAVIKKGTLHDVHSLYDLRDKRACFAGVQTYAGWLLPVYTLMRQGGMDIVDCNNHVKSATRFFGPSCAVNCLTDKYNPVGDNSDKLCQLCIGKIPGGRCTDSDPYAGFEGAFRCLLEAGEIAFLKHTTIPELVSGDEFTAISKDSFELLCKDGSRRPINDHLSCHWGKVPSNTIVTTSASSFELRKIYQKFLEKAVRLYGRNTGKKQQSDGDQNSNNRNTFDRNQNVYDRQPEYDQFGNRIHRFKRQNFGTQTNDNRYNQYGQSTNDNQYNQYGQSTNDQNYDPNNKDGLYSSTTDQYNRDNINRDQFNYNRFNQDNYNQNTDLSGRRDQFGSTTDQYNRNNQYQDGSTRNFPEQYPKNPDIFNPNQYGVNIDPYEDTSTYNKNINPIEAFNDTLASNLPNLNATNVTYYEVFNMFESAPRYGIHGNLLFQDTTRGIVELGESQQTYSNFLGDALHAIMGVRDCQVNRMTMCVTSDMELDKCVKMRTALKAQLLKPEMDCYKGHSQIHCMQAIRSGTADVAVFDASDVYTAGLNYDLVPFISEMYNLNTPEYYVVAVGKESDPSTELTYLRGKFTCHGGINTAAGWVYPLAFLISNGWIRPYGCNSIRAAAEYFSKSCVPGALSTEYNTGVPYDNMCDLCHGASFRYCRRDASEDYYGHTGAFRCLVEGGGQVAFVKHTTVTENTGGKREEWWARDNLNDDFELLCPDGTRAEVNEYTKCNLGKVKANAIVTRGGYDYNATHINAYINLFTYAQRFYGRKSTDEFSFSMFSSTPPYTDLIFQDATTQLKVIEPSQRYYSTYLGRDFMRARRIVDCHAGSASISASIVLIIFTSVFIVIRL